MADKKYWSEPTDVGTIETPNRSIKTKIPIPEDIRDAAFLRDREPVSMTGQPPIFWDRAEGRNVYDRAGNKWLDFSSGVVVASAGHSHPRIVQAIKDAADGRLLHTYCFPNRARMALVARLTGLLPRALGKVFLLTTGSEATEAALKISRVYARKTAGREKSVVVTFQGAFHGRTLGAQMSGGIAPLKEWIVNHDAHIVQVGFPGDLGCPDDSFEFFLATLAEKGVTADRIAMIMTETYQGGTVGMLPRAFATRLREFCDAHRIVLTMDEVQAGFGRTGRLFGFEHYGIVPDLACFGKGISSSLPLAAIAGRAEIMDAVAPNHMTSTHTGNPVCAAAALANIDAIIEEKLVENSRRMGEILAAELREFEKYDCVGRVNCCGLVAAIQFVRPGTVVPDGTLAFGVNRRAIEKGLMLFSPVGPDGSSIKLAPPLSITAAELREGIGVLKQAFGEIVG